MRLPDFVVVGAMKSGSTSLLNALGDHPEIFMPKKEVHYFNKYHHLGLEWYARKFSAAQSSHRIVGEKTPTYSYLESIPQKMYEILPNTKLIWILREPVARAYSNYWHAAWRGKEELSFEEAVDREGSRIKSDVYKGYLARSRYANQIENFKRFYPIEQMKFVLLDDLIADSTKTLQSVLSFLSVDDNPNHAKLMRVGNKTNYTPKNLHLHEKMRRRISSEYGFRAFSLFNRVAGVPKIDPELRDRLKKLFDEDNKRLEGLIGRDLSMWN